ncbi:MAG: DNA recombination protein RmuC [Elusimicrobiota bacterium]|jgi:DNA recombination protein RmuC|nr:DNA recombination protein RmuC [Elusimicrobiota bacterium]
MDLASIAIAFLLGGLIGFAATFFSLRKRSGILKDDQITQYIEKAGKLDSVLESHQNLLSEIGELKTKLDEKDNAAQQLKETLHSYQIKEASYSEREKTIAEKYDFLVQEKEKLLTESKTVFESIAANIIEKHSKNFKEANQTELSHILNPLKDSMKNYQETITAFNKEQNEKTNALDNAIKRNFELNQNLAKEASDLTTALQNKKVQGNWGEMVLERVLEWAGLEEGREYEKQVFFKNQDNERQYPDFIIKLPKDRKVIIDSKMSIENYKRWANETDETLKKEYLQQHVKDIRKHIEELADKEYQKLIRNEGLDFVIMFIPIEYAYFAALSVDNDLIEFAGKRKIAIATASSLFPILKVVEGLWRIERSNKNNEEIIKAGEEMHKRVEAFLEDMESLGDIIKKTNNSYDKAMTRLIGGQGIIKSAAKLERFGIRHQKSLKNADQDEAQDDILKIESTEVQQEELALNQDETKQ